MRILGIINLAIVIPIHWFAGNSHDLSSYGCLIRSMGRLADLLETKMNTLSTDPTLIINEDFMKKMFTHLQE